MCSAHADVRLNANSGHYRSLFSSLVSATEIALIAGAANTTAGNIATHATSQDSNQWLKNCYSGHFNISERAYNRKYRDALFYSNLAGTENGLVASTTNIMSASSSVVPLLKTSIVIPAGCPFIECPASTFITPCGVRCPNLPAIT